MKTNTKKTARGSRKAKTLDEMLAGVIRDRMAELKLTQIEAAYRMKDAPSQVSLVCTGKLRGFSTKRLLRMAMALGVDVGLVLQRTNRYSPQPSRIGAGRGRIAIFDTINEKAKVYVSVP